MLVGKYMHAEHVKYCIGTKTGSQHSQFLEKLRRKIIQQLKIQKLLHAKKTCLVHVLNHEHLSLSFNMYVGRCKSVSVYNCSKIT